MALFMRFWRGSLSRLVAVVMLLAMMAGLDSVVAVHSSISALAATSSCQLKSARGNIQHVIYVQFDNTHFTRDNPNVPSDLEQMPHLLNFIKNNGVLLSNHHTPLIAHTATDILTSITGLYGDRQGVPISNSYQYYKPNGTTSLGISFAYWTDPIFDPTTSHPTDTKFNLIDQRGQNTPAPWVPYTRAGCNVGSVATANTVLENSSVDVAKVFGANSPQAMEAKKNPTLASADFVGIGVHCAQGNSLCSSSNGGEPDVLPDEPGGYHGYTGLFGQKYVAPQISPNGPLKDLNGQVIMDPSGNIGFPGFDGMQAPVSLAYVAAMQEHGIPITYAYISAAHETTQTGNAFGPGQAPYVKKLATYDNAFATFFARLAHDGINQSNTLFVFTADEGDHFVGGPPSPKGCDGVTTPCTYKQIGELEGNLTGLLATQQGITTPFTVHADAAPVIYITGKPARGATVARNFERATGPLTAKNLITGQTDMLTRYMADPVEMQLLHMITVDPARTATFTMFANPDYYLFTGPPNCTKPCITEFPPEAWNHGDVNPDINTTWLGMAGPGVKQLGVDGSIWSDHSDTRSTMLTLLGLKDDYSHSGRALFEVLQDWAVPPSLLQNRAILTQLAQVFKQINACVGALGLDTLKISTKALESHSAGDKTYTQLETKLSEIGGQRDNIAQQMLTLLENAEFNGKPINAQQAQHLIDQGNALLKEVGALAGK